MKKIVILAISALLVANISAQEMKKECKKFTKEEKLEFKIKRFTNELMLSDQQAEKFAVTYREYATKLDEVFEANKPAKMEPGKELTDAELDKMAKQRFEGFKKITDLQNKYYDKFRKDLSARQVEKVMRLDAPFDPKPCFGNPPAPNFDGKACGPMPNGPKFEGKPCDKKHGHHHPEGPLPAPQPAPKAE